MKKIALGLVLMTMIGCHAQVKVQAKAETPPPKVEEPAPPPPPPAEPEVKAGDQITLPDQIEFDNDQATIKQTPKTLETLDKLAELMRKHPNVTKLRIEGHTDNVGNKKHNAKLSKARADAVAKWLTEHEVDAQRLSTIGFGAKRPVKPNDSEANRAQNRRTEYYVEELDGKKVEAEGGPQKVTSSPTPVAPAKGKTGG
jgi:outer membrane protein OmpA-like peptidoglycan-associated protein